MKDNLLAPNGKPSNLTAEQYALVRTKAFKDWFGDWENHPQNASKVVDENGEPLVVYHTTNDEFTIFSKKKSKEGFFFSPQKERLSVYGKSRINSYFLNLRNPSHEMGKQDIKYLSPKGYDGVMDYGYAKHLGNEGLYEIIAFQPNQIKLADGSNTTFDGSNPDIRYDGGGITWDEYVKTQFNEDEHRNLPSHYFDDFEIEEKNLQDYPNLLKIKNGLEYRKWKFGGIGVFDGSKIIAFADNGSIQVSPKYSRKGIGLELVSLLKEINPKHRFGNVTPQGWNLMRKYYETKIANNSDIRFDDGGEVEDLINEGIVDLKMYETTPEHAREYGFDSFNPLYIQTICVNNDSRLKGIGKKVLTYIDEYAKKNGNDVVFGHITQKAEFTKDERQNLFCDIDLIKNWLFTNGYAINDNNNDFHKVIESNVEYNNGGDMKSNLLAPNGKPSNLTAEQYALVRTKAFKDWFGDWENDPQNASKVVDDNGEPLVVYHATFDSFYTFSPQTLIDSPQKVWYEENTKRRVPEGFYFTDDKEAALEFAIQKLGGELSDIYYLEKVILMQVFLNIKNPEPNYLKEPPYYLPNLISQKPFVLKSVQQGVYDGFISQFGYLYLQSSIRKVQGYTSDPEDVMPEELWGKEYIVIHSNQIKLADGSNTTFDGNNPDIRFDGGGEVKESKVFGNFAFADQYNPINKTARLLQGTKEFEPDTKLEEKIFEMLMTWTQYPSNAQDIYIKRDILQQAKKDYPKVFAPNFKGLVYRGLSADFEELHFPKNVSLQDFEKISVGRDNNYFLYKKPIQYKPKKIVESWTTNIKTAISFGGNVVLISKVDDSFYMNPKIMNTIYYGADEDETIKIGKDFTKNVFVMCRDLEDIADYIKKQVPSKLETLKFTKRFNNGGEMKKVDKGGITYGKSHDEGGIPVKNASTGQMLEVEGGEGIVNKRSMASDKKVKMNGKEMTICEAVSQLNQMEGGVKFSCDDVAHRQFIEQMELGGELERGQRTEKEHIETLRKLYEKSITPNEAVTEIAKEHIAENPNYYSDLQKMKKEKSEYSPSLIESVEKNFYTYNVPLHLISPIESRDFEYDEPMAKFERGGISKPRCGCDHKVQKYMNGGIFGGGLDELSYFKEPTEEDKMAEKCVRVLEKARKILNQDLRSKLMTKKLDESLVKYFAPFQKINLYDDGWRFAYGQSKQWAGLCAIKGLEQHRGKKTLYLSVDFVKKDEVFEKYFEEVVYHEMAHALVVDYIQLKTPSMKEIDPLHFVDTKEQPYGHGKIWANICKCLDANCEMFYRKAQFSSNWKEFKYECSNCGETRYGDTKNFTQICYKCFKAVYVTKNNE